ncbi:molybdopterin-binding protein [Sedimentibacter saalensis]|jgi:molybdenum cofactor synthesis domain-containing protein|uniref:Molybdopterin molybdenumtransferase n=1 Tax=Sedimentibacter saalensis TaxID=130788 RepID=A0A562J172_9FIRM|nr:molybdopterin-binding protein [Sedimentibacter saalensis]TWH77009.1 molybdenum cofactor synthesis domain-containing protein [Sedimentibacter saalensis]
MKSVNIEEAVGQVLCHDITQIIKDVKKDVVFKKGHVIKKEDIPVFLSVGKEHIYIWEKQDGMLHENEAADILYSICKNEYMKPSAVKEGKIEVISEIDGLFKVDKEKLYEVNSIGDMMIATRHGNTIVRKGDKLAGTRVIPLVIEEEKMKKAQEIGGGKPILKIMPLKHKKIGIVTTGSEVFHGRIKDAFGPVIVSKFSEFDSEVIGQTIVDDEREEITAAIIKFIENGSDIVVCTGGMSVDPDDRTPGAIKDTGAEIVSYGAPVLPGAMLLVSYYSYQGRKIPVIGLPGCVMYSKRTIFDLILPRLMADDILNKSDIDKLGQGGLCLNCETCTYPNCGFGKGM